MKYGQQLEKESVPRWRVHNLDYNTLKQYIKVHTTRDQATAITIPGQTDTALQRFENDFYDELCRQHDRVGLFVVTKADELNRRLQHLTDQVQRLVLRTSSPRGTVTIRRQRRLAKYDRLVLQLGDETRDLTRFVNAQVVAFRKILKKYRKWTGSSSLGVRFRENVLSDPKSFTRRDFTHLQSQCDELLTTVREATPLGSQPQSGSASPALSDSGRFHRANSAQYGSSSSSTLQALSSSAGSIPPVRTGTDTSSRRVAFLPRAEAPTHYWNEYDDGSEAGDVGGDSGGYTILLQPEEEAEFPGMATLVSFFSMPIEKAKKWIAARGGHVTHHPIDEHAPLLGANAGYGSSGLPNGNGNAVTGSEPGVAEVHSGEEGDHDENDDDDDDEGDQDSLDGDDVFGSDIEFPQGYETYYASLPSIDDQRMARYRETVLFRGLLGCFAAALVLLGVASILIATGRHKMRVEVDAGVTMGVVTSLGFACAALGMNMARHGRLSLLNEAAAWTAFAAICILNGVVLVFVLGNTAV